MIHTPRMAPSAPGDDLDRQRLGTQLQRQREPEVVGRQRLRGDLLALMTMFHPASATSGSTLIPTVLPGSAWMVWIPVVVDPSRISWAQSPGDNCGESNAQHSASDRHSPGR